MLDTVTDTRFLVGVLVGVAAYHFLGARVAAAKPGK